MEKPRILTLDSDFSSKNAFIVHGHDIEPVNELKAMLKDFGLNPIVLHEKASGGLTLAEKLEKYAGDVGFTFVILTPDDVGCEKTIIEKMKFHAAISRIGDFRVLLNKLKPRARQNVIFEMGYFWGLLRRRRVCCLLKEDVERPSDIEGIVYVPFKDSLDECRDTIIRELKEAEKTGFDILSVKGQREQPRNDLMKLLHDELEDIKLKTFVEWDERLNTEVWDSTKSSGQLTLLHPEEVRE